ncbi:putative Tetraspanin family [Monocercomonoides exilis]|uniref:putative Tetraspanin family n=1 Tax=Monocercomonoides exilis TaxID=2049356 RepID=UPI00355953E0|nr:putative Tetraspanin family [Monocercomonoides exilis]
MGLCYADEQPKKKCSLLMKIMCIIYFILGLAILVLGIVWIAVVPGSTFVAVILIIVGIAVIVTAFFGLLGSGYIPEEKEGRYKCLAIFFVITLVAGVALVIIGCVCLLSEDTIKNMMIMHWDSFQEVIDNVLKALPEEAKEYSDAVTKAIKEIKAIGIVAIIAGVIILIGFVFCCYMMGFDKFIMTTLGLGSIVVIVVGVVLVAVCIYFYAYEPLLKDSSGLLIGGIVIGAVIIVIGLFGLISSCCCIKKSVWPIRIYFIILLLITLAALIVGIVCFAMSNTVMETVEKTLKSECGVKDEDTNLNESSCAGTMDQIMKYMCNGTLYLKDEDFNAAFIKGEAKTIPNCEVKPGSYACYCRGTVLRKGNEFDVIYDNVKSYMMESAKGNYQILGAAGIIVAVFMLYMVIAAFIMCCCIGKKYQE